MRALLCIELGGADLLTVAEVPDPVPQPGEVVIDVRAAGLNFPDALMIAGKYQIRPDLPFTPGAEASGIVSAVGDGVDLPVGSEVIGLGLQGAFAEKWAVPGAVVIPKPPELSYEESAGFGLTYGTAYHALKQQARLVAGESLVVLGAAGGVGSAAVQVGKAMGARVIAAAGSGEKLEFAASLGADDCINYNSEDLKTRVRELTGGDGADVVYDPVGGDVTEPALRATKWGGRFLVIGFASGEIPRIPLNLLLLKGIHAIGVYWGSWVAREPEASAANYAELFEMISNGSLTLPAVEMYPLDDYVAAFDVLTGRRARGKVVFRLASA